MSLGFQNSVVLITSNDPSISRFGTGFVIHHDEHATYSLTCAHVVSDVGGSEKVKVGSHVATVIASGTADSLDLAVLRIEGLADKPSLILHASGERGSRFVAAGFQLFDKHYLIRPIRGNLGEQVGLETRGQADRIKAWDLKIDDDYTLQPGYSGAPVVDEVTRGVLSVVSHRQGEGKKGLAISIEALRKIWPQMPSDLFAGEQQNKPLISFTTSESGTLNNLESPEENVKAVTNTPEKTPPSPINKTRLRTLLTTYFNDGELHNLCSDLNIDYEILPAEGKENKARELIDYAERHGCIQELIDACRQLRPSVSW